MSSSTVSGYDHPQHFGLPSFHGGVPLAPGGNPGGVPTVSGGIPPAIPYPPVALPFPVVVLATPMVIPAVVPVVASVVVPAVAPAVVPTAPSMVPAAVHAAPVPITPYVAFPVASIGVRAKLLKLDLMKDAKAFLDLLDQTLFYLRMPEFSTGHADGSLTTNARNLDASCAWEGQLHLAVKEGSLRFLFENKGSLFHGPGFEMLDTLMQHCQPDTVSNTFTSLLSLFNDVQRDSKSIIKYRSCLDGVTLELAPCKVVILSILLVMLFLRALHGWYKEIVNQFWMHFKPIETTILDLIVSDVTYHNGFLVVDHSKEGKPGSGSGPRAPAAASADTNSDRQGKVWPSPFKWLAQYGIKGIKGCWMHAMAGTGICPICHCDKLPRHVPTQCPLLAELNLKLIKCHPVASSPSSSAPPQHPLPSPAPAPTPGGHAAAIDASSATGSSGSSSTPFGLTAAFAPAAPPPRNFDSDDEYHWESNDVGVEYAPPPKVNTPVAPYLPSCSHVCIVPSLLTSALSPLPQA
jgi:hypothetical protein